MRSAREAEPRVQLREGHVVQPSRPNPRRVPHLQIEPAPLEDRSELELPVKEALALGDRTNNAQPRMVSNDVRNTVELNVGGKLPLTRLERGEVGEDVRLRRRRPGGARVDAE